ncbi:hypothetical protein ABZ721_30600 [Streptomyces sp. NPDC006733]|uniref:hypothetical protein n=1 Tax=Streptomyces sp. NPDC006733 TaxID=3155460 RepID=UPI0033F1CA5C
MSFEDVGVREAPLATQQEWLTVRSHLQQHRHELSVAAGDCYQAIPTVARTALLTRPEWLPVLPLEMDAIRMEWDSAEESSGREADLRSAVRNSCLVPRQSDGSPFRSYSAAMAELAAPAVFQNRSTYRLRLADLSGAAGAARMRFTSGTYFDGIDLGEACAHEYTASRLGRVPGTPLRDAIGTPCRLDRRPVNLAVATLVLRHDAATGCAQFPLHWRDPAKVGQAGGMYMVIPVGIFQPASDCPGSRANDFSLWRCVLREFAEELLGEAENPDRTQPIDYAAWPVAVRLDEERRRGRVRTYALGLGTDPLTLATDLLTVMVIDSGLWDDLAVAMVTANTEGRLARPEGSASPASTLFPFTETGIDRTVQDLPLEVAGAALLRLAWHHRRFLLN